jgi:hypothetical protein
MNWLRNMLAGRQQKWARVQQVPGTTFPFPRGAKLRPHEEVVFALPSAVISGDEKIGDVFLIDDDAEITLNDEPAVWYVKLRPGMTFALGKSCEVMLIAADERPRFFDYLAPEKKPRTPANRLV